VVVVVVVVVCVTVPSAWGKPAASKGYCKK